MSLKDEREKRKKEMEQGTATKICKHCKSEIPVGAKVCPQCRKKQGMGCLPKVLIALAVIIVIGIVAGLGGDDTDTNTTNNTPNEETSSSTKKEETKEDVKEEEYEIDLSAGNYIAGKDIPVGTYNLTAVSGSGNVISSNMFSGGLNEVMGAENDGLSQQSFNGLKMESDTTLYIAGNLVLHIASTNAQVASVVPRSSTDATPIDLQAGNYTAGTDFPAGTYNIVATGNIGNVSSDNMFEGGLNEVMGTEDDGMSVQQFNNAIFEDGTNISVSGTTVQLVPVGE